jgi:translation initiation factor 1 (eIF-1/SUI1)
MFCKVDQTLKAGERETKAEGTWKERQPEPDENVIMQNANVIKRKFVNVVDTINPNMNLI